MITGFAIKNFKNLAQIPPGEGELVPFGPLNVLIGPNGCGKSSLLQAIDFLRAFFRSSAEVYLQERGWNYRDLPNLRESNKLIRWELKANLEANKFGKGAGTYHYVVTLQPRKHLGIGEEHLTWAPANEPHASITLIERKGRTCTILDRFHDAATTREMFRLPASILSTLDAGPDRVRYPEALHFREWVEGFRSFLIWDPKILRAPSRGKHVEIGQSGENLATVIGQLKDRSPASFEKLVRRIRRLFPTISDISISGRGWGWRHINLHETNGKKAVFNSQQMSDGILRLLAVTTLLYLDEIPTVLTFEEPENGVHPQLLREVVQILRELTQRKPPNRCQVFLTTHSPYVLDEFYDHPEEVYCMDRPEPQAGGRVIRLSDKAQLAGVRQHFEKSLGEAWVSGLLGASAGMRTK
ncbi:MAG: AAA family ATPase [Gemmataceae bacterium]|nr:AAA family ATPase [Gemmataceae bacterium]